MAGPSCHCREVRDFKVGIGVWLGRAHQLVECAHYQPAFLVGYARCAVAHELLFFGTGIFGLQACGGFFLQFLHL